MDSVKVCRESWYFFKQNITLIISILFPFFILTELVYAMFPESSLGQVLLPIFLLPISQAALIMGFQSRITGETLSAIQCYMKGLPYFPVLLGVFILSGIAMVVGLIAFIIPGFLFMSRLMIAQFEAVIGGKGVYESLSDSWNVVKPVTWPVLSGYLMITILSIVPMLLFGLLTSGAESPVLALELIGGAIGTLLSALPTIYAFRIYSKLVASPQSA
ncbi:hypothetical protein [Vibrio sp. SCSIO 43136]|uniref:hypothetical protein n=1 Tax=Vibrio sp. SCSIO 43136 TaxID=2819101 RepID=UPI00207528BC|nr:hypothetical protein [Vibrio sp. SCSIO 43136]USD67005.1 hypothetical protein J4N39_20425 [Vibrio sp. SCSIO 43136]